MQSYESVCSAVILLYSQILEKNYLHVLSILNLLDYLRIHLSDVMEVTNKLESENWKTQNQKQLKTEHFLCPVFRCQVF